MTKSLFEILLADTSLDQAREERLPVINVLIDT